MFSPIYTVQNREMEKNKSYLTYINLHYAPLLYPMPWAFITDILRVQNTSGHSLDKIIQVLRGIPNQMIQLNQNAINKTIQHIFQTFHNSPFLNLPTQT